MILIPFLVNLYDKAQEKNVLAGIIIIDLIAFIAYIIFPSGIFFFGDLHMIIGSIIGVRFALKYKKQTQSYLKYGIIVGILGSMLAGFSMALYQWIIFSLYNGFMIFILLGATIIFLILGMAVGLVMGGIIGLYYSNKIKNTNTQDKIDDSFYESLKK